jgi:general secretion pathway protein J
MKKSSKQGGFTLIELLVSIAIFSTMTVIAYAGIGSIMSNDQTSAEHETDLKRLQRTMLFLEKDLRQVINRTRNDGFSGLLPPLKSDGDSNTGFMEFTRAGNSNPTDLKRSSLLRVRYLVEEEKLQRITWNLVDYSDTDEPPPVTLMTGVTEVKVSFLPESGDEVDEWNKIDELPMGVEITLTTERWGQIRRVFPLYY